jgi:putative transcriptional regulator
MNQNHPSRSFLDLLASGKLDDTVSIVISSHVEGCRQCQKYIAKKEAQLADTMFKSVEEKSSEIPEFSKMQEIIINSSEESVPQLKYQNADNVLTFKSKTVDLPATLKRIKKHMSPWKSFGNISYSKINVQGQSNLYFVHFEPGVKIAEHTHDGNEYAYVLAGSFQDQHAEYITGDFASFSRDDSHHPYTEDPDGCMLLVTIEGPFVFKEGWARLLNPFRKLFFGSL